ncbi:SRPBCC family protein [Aquihabitans sp. McL0605]|uniref:SRPBCC family protein n=1 Tax=Aquihabitans sp. McL0605 TaxID=3415671 RepID=UPI003CE8F11A
MSEATITTTGTDEGLGEVTIVREFDAPRDLIWAAFMDPEQLSRFWGPIGMSTPADRIVLEPRVGGRFLTVMVHDESGDEYPTTGEFVEFDEPNVFAFREPDSGMISQSTFEDLGDGRTRLTIHQTNVPAPYRSPDALAGFNTALDKLVTYLAEVQA